MTCTAWPKRKSQSWKARNSRFFVFRPDGAPDCSRGWSGAAENRPDAQPVETKRNPQYYLSVYFFAPEGRRNGLNQRRDRHARHLLIRRASRRFLRPSGAERGKRERKEYETCIPRVARRPLCGRRSTRGYSPRPPWGRRVRHGNSGVTAGRKNARTRHATARQYESFILSAGGTIVCSHVAQARGGRR